MLAFHFCCVSAQTPLQSKWNANFVPSNHCLKQSGKLLLISVVHVPVGELLSNNTTVYVAQLQCTFIYRLHRYQTTMYKQLDQLLERVESVLIIGGRLLGSELAVGRASRGRSCRCTCMLLPWQPEMVFAG